MHTLLVFAGMEWRYNDCTHKFNVNKLWNKWTFLQLFDSRPGNWISEHRDHLHL